MDGERNQALADSGDHFVVICSPPPVGSCISSHDSLLQHVFLYFLPDGRGLCSRTEVDKFKESPSLDKFGGCVDQTCHETKWP